MSDLDQISFEKTAITSWRPLKFHSHETAVSFVRDMADNYQTMDSLRNALNSHGFGPLVLSDQSTIDQIAWKLVFAEFKILVPPGTAGPQYWNPRQDPVVEPEPVSETTATPTPETPKTPVVESEPELDAAAQADALTRAAEDGAPFCEECEKLAQEETAAPASPPPQETMPEVAASPQADTLVRAAENGESFCEICESMSGSSE